MEKIKPKKNRKFLKAMGDIALTLFRELVLGIGKKVINKVGNKRQGLVIAFLLVAGISYASIDSIPYPVTGNKQRLGWQTSGNGLVYRGRSNDTITKPSSYVDKNVKAYLLLDSVRGTIFVWRQTYWDSILVGSGAFAQPVDSLFFDTSVPSNDVDTAKMRWDSELGTVVLGMYDQVPNELGFKNFWLVKNQTGLTITKGSIVYANGTVGASGRITVDKFIANGSIDAKYLLGITAHDLSNGEDGYVISFGKIRQVNTDTFAAGSILYPSPTVAGVWTDVEPVAPNIDMPIGFCINSSVNNGTIAIRVASGYKLSELHDIAISSPIEKASLYYSSGLWRDTTAALLVSDTASMLANYSLKSYVDSIAQNFQDSIDEITNGYFKQEFPTVTKDTLNWTKPVQLPVGGSNLLLVYRNGQMINDAQYSVIDTNKVKINSGSYKLGENYTVVYVKGGGGSGSGGVPFDTSVLNLQARLDLKLNISDTAAMLANYATKAYADTTGRFYARQDFSNVSSSTLTWTQSDTLVTGGVNVVQVYRNGQILLPSQYTIPSSTSVVISATSYKAGENYTVIFPRGGGAGSGGGSGSLTSISAGTGITVSPNPITTSGTISADLSVLMELTDTTLLNLTSRFNAKQNTLVSGTNIKTVNSNSLLGSGNISVGTLVGDDTVSLSNRINTKLNSTDTASLSNRINLKLNATDTASLSNRINAKGNGTVTSVATGYGLSGGTITTTGTLRLDSATVYNYIRDSIVDVQIGNDTIKILKQEYNNVTSDTLTWTITSKFPIQLRAYILLFRNGQLLINNQYSIIDTNKIKVAVTSYKLGENYTVVTVSGIGSAGISQTGNPIYPDAGIALSTGSTWASSIPNNSTNWNTAFTDRLKWDGNSTGLTPSTGRTSLGGTTIGQSMFTLTNPSAITFPRFNADNTVTSRSAANFRTDIGAGTVTSVNVAAGTPLSIQNNTTIPEISMSAATGSVNGYLTSTDWTTFNNKQNALSNASASVSGILTSTDWTTFNNKENTIIAGTTGQYFRGDKTFQTLDKSAVGLGNVDNTSDANKPISTATQTALNLKVNISDTASMLTPYFRDSDTTLLNLTSRFATKLNISDTASMLTPYLRKADTTNMLLPYFRDADTSLLNLTSRFATKLNLSDTLNMLVPYLRKADTTNMLLPYFRDADTSQLNLTSRFATKQNTLTNPVTGTGTNNFVPKFTSTGSTIGNSTIQDNGTTVSTSSILSTTNYASFNTTQVMSNSSGILSTHRFTSANANGVYDKNFFLTSYMGAPWQGSDIGSGNRSKPPIVAIVNNNDPSFINSGLHLMTTNSTNNTYTPAITFGVNSENGLYYNTIGAITAKKLNTGNYTSQSAGQLEFFGTGTALDATGASMTTANMTLGVGVGIGYTTAPTVRGRLIVSEKLGINQSTPNFTLDVSGTANITGAATLGSTLAVTGNITEAGNNVLTNLDTASLSSRIDSKQNALTLTTTGISGAATFNGSTLNIPNYTSGSGTVTSVSGTGAISVANSTTTPVISVADAAFGTAGIVTATGTQQFSGDKTFEGITQFNARAVFKDYTYVATRLAGLSSTDRFATVTIGSGLSLSSGTLSATGGTGTVTNVTGTLPISVANGTTTPSITIADAGTGASGVVNTTTQSFAGNKTFTGNVVMQNDIDNREGYIRRKYVAGSAATYTVLDNDTWIRWGRSDLVTFTLPNASDFPGREIYILNIGNGSITSNATNIQQLDGSQNSQITGAGPGKWCTLVSTGSTYWQKMAGN